MHMALVIVGGLGLLAVFTLFGHLWRIATGGIMPAAYAFIAVWFVISCINMWLGVTRAGYTVMQELPVNLVVFAVPALIAGGIIWYAMR
jgi:hypothetical protein